MLTINASVVEDQPLLWNHTHHFHLQWNPFGTNESYFAFARQAKKTQRIILSSSSESRVRVVYGVMREAGLFADNFAHFVGYCVYLLRNRISTAFVFVDEESVDFGHVHFHPDDKSSRGRPSAEPNTPACYEATQLALLVLAGEPIMDEYELSVHGRGALVHAGRGAFAVSEEHVNYMRPVSLLGDGTETTHVELTVGAFSLVLPEVPIATQVGAP
jgi:hypothetical protein